MRHGTRKLVVAGLAVAALAVPATASDPMGVYCIVDRVVLEPADCPDRAQVWGVCAVAQMRSWQFEAPARGYFYYSVPAGREEQSRAEWADLKSVAGSGQVVGFGRRHYSAGTFRAGADKPASPDVYPLHLGVMRITGRNVAPEVNEVAQRLRNFRGK
jgi:hypothetical protein